jgi:hypothetical protein
MAGLPRGPGRRLRGKIAADEIGINAVNAPTGFEGPR